MNCRERGKSERGLVSRESESWGARRGESGRVFGPGHRVKATYWQRRTARHTRLLRRHNVFAVATEHAGESWLLLLRRALLYGRPLAGCRRTGYPASSPVTYRRRFTGASVPSGDAGRMTRVVARRVCSVMPPRLCAAAACVIVRRMLRVCCSVRCPTYMSLKLSERGLFERCYAWWHERSGHGDVTAPLYATNHED